MRPIFASRFSTESLILYNLTNLTISKPNDYDLILIELNWVGELLI